MLHEHIPRLTTARDVVSVNTLGRHRMTSPRLLIFDDGQGRFGPLTDRRAAYSIRTGAFTSRQRIEVRLGMAATDLHLPRSLEAVQRSRERCVGVNQLIDPGDAVLAVNGRWTGVEHVEAVRTLAPSSVLLQRDGQVLAAHLTGDALIAFVAAGFIAPPPGATAVRLDTCVLLERPWHVLDQLEPTLACDLASHQPRIAATASVHPSAVLDDSGGPIVLDDHAVVGALSVLEGPCYIGTHSTVMPRSLIRRNTVIGPTCRVAGEIAFSIIHGHSNKSHEGFLGHSLVGEWVNLGAATNVSNLKNTYGDVQVQLQRHAGSTEDTGRTFCGPIIGDFVRTAIGTRLTTGSVIGTGAMIAVSTFAPKFVERFAFLTDKGSMPTDIDKLIHTARAMMSRRDRELTDADEQLLRDLAT
jgi:UDP-N-acetylglucosamine diphosphorylase/glucosamine-1-phosphate N-acetyltransferase